MYDENDPSDISDRIGELYSARYIDPIKAPVLHKISTQRAEQKLTNIKLGPIYKQIMPECFQ